MTKLLLIVGVVFSTTFGVYAQGLTTATISGQVKDKKGEGSAGSQCRGIAYSIRNNVWLSKPRGRKIYVAGNAYRWPL